MDSIILSLHQDIVSGKKSIVDIVKESINKIKDVEWSNSVITECFDKAVTQASLLDKSNDKNNLLFGIPYGLKDNFCTKNFITTAGSQFLKDYLPPFDSTVYDILNKNHSILTCKTAMDELGMGGSGLNSTIKASSNIKYKNRIAGGSSSGSVNLVACGAIPFAIGSDTGDSARRPATFVGVVGYKPTYGLISRYGVLPYAPSLDTVGIITRTVKDTAIVMSELTQFDNKDYTSQKTNERNFFSNLKNVQSLKIGILKVIEQYLQPNVLLAYLKVIELLKRAGHQIIYVNLTNEELKAIHPVYYGVSFSESVSCWSNLTGINFGPTSNGHSFDNIIKTNRTYNICNEVKRRFVIGAYMVKKENFENCFIRSQKLRHYLSNKWNECLNNVDCILCAGAASIAPLIEDVKKGLVESSYAEDLLIAANLAGTPSISIPGFKVDGYAWGINLNCKQFQDQQLLNIAHTIESLFETEGVFDE